MSQLGNTRTDFYKILYWVILRNVVEPLQLSFAPAYSENRFTCRLMWISTSWWSATHYAFTAKISRKCAMVKNKGHTLYFNQYLRKYRRHLENYRKKTTSLRFTNVCSTVTEWSFRDAKEGKTLWLSVWIYVRSFYFFSIVLYHNRILNHT